MPGLRRPAGQVYWTGFLKRATKPSLIEGIKFRRTLLPGGAKFASCDDMTSRPHVRPISLSSDTVYSLKCPGF